MSEPVSIASQAAIAQTTSVQPLAEAPEGISSSTDLERLRALIAEVGGTQDANIAEAAAASEVQGVSQTEMRAPGDAILEGISGLKDGYHGTLDAIENRLQVISNGDPSAALGSDFSQIMGLQLDIARWTMSVMGVDNSTKAGTNTIKELSKGG